MYPLPLVFLCSWASLEPLTTLPHLILRAPALSPTSLSSSVLPSPSRSQPPQASFAPWPFLPLQDCISPASCSNLSRTILEAELALWQKKRTAGKKTLLTKETSTFKCLWEGLQNHLLAHMWNFQQSAFLLGEVGKKQAPQTGRLSKSKELQTSHSSSALLPAPFIWTRPLLFFFTPLTWKPCCKNSKSQALPTAVSHDSETKRLIGMHLKEVLGLGDSGKIITARSFLCLLIFLNLYGRSTGLLYLNAFFIIILIVHCRIKIPTVDLLHYSTN